MNITIVLLALVFLTGAICLSDVFLFACWKSSRCSRRSAVVDLSRILFPTLLIILLVRVFLYAPYRVPTASLEPTVKPGDVVLVKQSPLVKHINRGDLVVFKHPVFRHAQLLKRVIGLPGDHISYINKTLYINDVACPLHLVSRTNDHYSHNQHFKPVTVYNEDLDGVNHKIYLRSYVKTKNFYDLVVPANEYFVMGDNRDYSDDSRNWGFVSRSLITGKAKVVWWSWDSEAKSLLSHVRWERIGIHV